MLPLLNNYIEQDQSDLISEKYILSLLNVLTDGIVQIDTETTNFNQLMITIFEQVKVPLVIYKFSLDMHNQIISLIQIKKHLNKQTNNEPEKQENIENIKEKEEQKRIILIFLRLTMIIQIYLIQTLILH